MCTVIPIDGVLDNNPVGCLLDFPLIEGAEHGDHVLTADDWLDLRVRRAAAGRPLDWWEVPVWPYAR